MLINTVRCEELGLSIPKSFDTERSYVLSVILSGRSLNTREARYIGIANLHSIVSWLKNSERVELTNVKGCVKDPATGEHRVNPVIIVSMTPEQIAAYKAKRHPEGCR